MDYFVNDDITTAILAHLPVKTLFICRSVSKSWRDVIDSSSFRDLHVQNQLSNNNNDDDDDTIFLQLMTAPRPENNHVSGEVLKTMIPDFPSYNDFLSNNETEHHRILFSGVVHGLICLYKGCSNNPIGLCNPILKKIKILPESQFPIKLLRIVALGYDSVEQDFKVVQLSPHPLQGGSTVVEVYSRKQNKWRELDYPLHSDIFISKPVCSSSSGGAFAHWYASDHGAAAATGQISRDLVVSFDMRSEAFKTIRIPCFDDSNKYSPVLAKEDSLIAFVWSGPGRLIMWEHKLLISGGTREEEDWIIRGSLGPLNGRVWPPLMWWKTGGLVYSCDGDYIAFHDCCTGQMVRCVHYRSWIRTLPYNRPTFISPFHTT